VPLPSFDATQDRLSFPCVETMSQSRKMHNCHSEQSEESNVPDTY
jgi:hypothetical protein